MRQQELKNQLSNTLLWEDAHVNIAKALDDIDYELAGKKARSVPYTIWQLTEHIRLVQSDILEYMLTNNYQTKEWPRDYWPESPHPESDIQWTNSLKQLKKDQKQVRKLLSDPQIDLQSPMSDKSGHTILREIILIIDHTAYHLGQIVLIRKILNKW